MNKYWVIVDKESGKVASVTCGLYELYKIKRDAEYDRKYFKGLNADKYKTIKVQLTKPFPRPDECEEQSGISLDECDFKDVTGNENFCYRAGFADACKWLREYLKC